MLHGRTGNGSSAARAGRFGDFQKQRIEDVLAMMEAYGSIKYVRRFAQALALDALRMFTDAFAPAYCAPDLKKFLVALVPYLLDGGKTAALPAHSARGQRHQAAPDMQR